MSEKHSPEPWRATDDAAWMGGARVWSGLGARMFEASEVDARRIVACVNACAGIPTEALGAGGAGALYRLLNDAEWFYSTADPLPPDGVDAMCALANGLRALGRLP
jgi:hypothetical protein